MDPFVTNVQYVHPSGSNSNPGTSDWPKKTISAAYIALAPGGVIRLASNCVWSDGSEVYTDHNGTHTLSASLGARVTGWVQGPTRPGFVPYKPCTFEGWGADNIPNFGGQGVSWSHGDSTVPDRTDPVFWIAPSTLSPTVFKDINFSGNLLFRQGWDYRRNDDGSIAWANVTGAVRTAGSDTQHTSSVFTVDFPTGWNILKIGRDHFGTVTVMIDMALQPPWPPLPPGAWVRITSTIPDFPSIDFQLVHGAVQDTSGPLPGAEQITFTYQQSGGYHDLLPPSSGSGTAQTHSCVPGDIIEFKSSNSQWPETIYEVQETTINTIKVRDPYGYDASSWGGVDRAASASYTDVGQYVLQDRQLTNAVDLTKFFNCSGATGAQHTIECFNVGPLMDFGSSFLDPYIEGGGFGGLAFDPAGGYPGSADYFRSAAIFAYGGGVGAAGLKTRLTNFVNGNILFQASEINVWSINCQDHLQDWGPTNLGTNYLRPCVEFVDNQPSGGWGEIRNCFNADQPAENPTVYLASAGGQVRVTGCSYVDQKDGTEYTFTDAPTRPLVDTDRRTWALEASSYEAMGRVGWYGNDQRLAGKRQDIQGLFGVVQGAGLVNCLDPTLTDWIPTGSIFVNGGISTATLDGGNNGFRITGSGDIQPVSFASPVAPTAAGDHFIFGAWVRGVGGGKLPNDVLFAYYVSNSHGAVPAVGYLTGLGGDGEWQWITAINTTDQVSTFISVRILCNGNAYDIAYPTLLRLPASSYSKNDAFRIMNTFRPLPTYLPPGMAGTFEGAKLIGHGGLGSDKWYVSGTSPGQATLGSTNGNLFEVFDKLGNSLGVTPLYSYTYHPLLSISPTSVTVAELGSQTFVGAGGVGPYAYSISVNHSGGSINSSSGVYTAGSTPGTDTITVTDSLSATANASVRVYAPLQISPSAPTVAAGGKQTFSATGGIGVYTLSISVNNSGGTIDPSTGVYQAGMVASGVSDTITVTDAALNTSSTTVTVTAFPGMKLWLNSAVGVTQSSGLVSAWADQSGNSNDASQATSSAMPTYNSNSVNGLPGLTMDGTDDFMAGSNNPVTAGTDRSVIVVTKFSSAVNSAGSVFCFETTAPYLGLRQGITGIPYVAGDGVAVNVVLAGGAGVTATPGVYEYHLASEVLTFYQNGINKPATTTPLTAEAGTAGYVVGAEGNGTVENFNGDILEIIVIDHVLTTTEQTNMRQYLQLKYSINLGV